MWKKLALVLALAAAPLTTAKIRHFDCRTGKDDRTGGLVCQHSLHGNGRNLRGRDHDRAGRRRSGPPDASCEPPCRWPEPNDFDRRLWREHAADNIDGAAHSRSSFLQRRQPERLLEPEDRKSRKLSLLCPTSVQRAWK